MKALKRLMAAACALVLLLPATAASAANVRGFLDVSDSAWYAEAVGYVYDRGLFSGESATSFLPDYTVSRGMFLTVLGRYAGAAATGTGKGTVTSSAVNVRSGPSTSYTKVATVDKGAVVTVFGMEGDWYKIGTGTVRGYIRKDLMTATDTTFTDVPYSQYYSGYIQWAYRLGIASGTGSAAFSPDAVISREQMCAILYNYIQVLGVALPQAVAKVSFADGASISPWASEAVSAMQQAGIFNGRGDGRFDPSAGASRAEVAAVLMRFCKLMDSLGVSPSAGSGTSPLDGYVIFGKVLGQSAAVGGSYYDDACFIGHSIINGLSQSYYNLFPNADFYARDGISAAGTLSYGEYAYTDENGRSACGSLGDALSANAYGKVYIMLGINEVGGKCQSFYNNMLSIIRLVRETQPGADIYLLSLTPLSEEYTAKKDAFAIPNLLEYNNALQQLSVEQDVYYIELFSYFADENGYLPAQYSADGLHLNRTGASALKTYLDQHTA